MKIQDLDLLTDNEFKMINRALDLLTKADVASDMVGMMLGGLIPKGIDRENYEREREKLRLKEEKKRDLQLEDIRLLQAKLIKLKRILTENRLLIQVNNHINPNDDEIK